MIQHLIMASIVILTGVGCSYTPPYPSSQVLFTKTIGCETTKSETLTIPKDDTPLEGVELINIALLNNPKTGIAWANTLAASYIWRASQSTLYPRVDGTVTYTHIDQTRTGLLPEEYEIIVKEITASYLLLDFGGRSASIESTRQALIEADWIQNRVYQDVIIEVLRAYYQVLSSQALLEARTEDLKDSQANLDAAESLYKAGVKNRLDFLLAKSNFIDAQIRLTEITGLLQIDLGRLATAIGLPADTKLSVIPLPQELPINQVAANLDNLISTAKEYRPDFAATYAEFLKRNADLAVAQSDGMPTIVADARMIHTGYPHFSTFNTHLYTSSLVLNVPVFAGFFYLNQQRAASARVYEAWEIYQNKELDIQFEVLSNYYAHITAQTALKYTEELLQYSTESYNAALVNYKEGINSILDLLQSQNDLANARAQLIQARTVWITSLANLAYSTGTITRKGI